SSAHPYLHSFPTRRSSDLFWRRLFVIELPLLLPVLSVAVLFGVVYSATDLGVVYILTGGGPANTTQVLSTLAFQRGALAEIGARSEEHTSELQSPYELVCR